MEKSLQIVALFTKDWKDMEHGIGRSNERYSLVFDAFKIAKSYRFAALVIGIKVFKFNHYDRRLHLINATIEALIGENILVIATVISKRLHRICKHFVIRCHATCIAESTHILTRIEAMCGGISYASGAQSVPFQPVTLGIILDK